MAAKLDEYVKTGAVDDTTPPPAPYNARAQRNEDGTVTITWEAQADFESGIMCFLIERDDRWIAQVPIEPVGRFGRPLFQTMSYHDTPEAPLPAMRFVDKTVRTEVVPTYHVRTVNSVRLKSKPAKTR